MIPQSWPRWIVGVLGISLAAAEKEPALTAILKVFSCSKNMNFLPGNQQDIKIIYLILIFVHLLFYHIYDINIKSKIKI